jgi:uncharacterized protein YlxW (UPF0749 family)
VREQNARLMRQVKMYKAECERLREEAGRLGRPMTAAGAREAREQETRALLEEVEDYDAELAALVKKNVTMLSEIQEELADLSACSP